ncbi:MAG: hypothetical protein KGK05_11125 [Xanthomonadaceae bacterium]|nr:hypothetical protein [Xanthomonadaceae bacterium]
MYGLRAVSLVLLLAPAFSQAQTPPNTQTVSVSGLANIFAAGSTVVPRGTTVCPTPNGILPVQVNIPAGAIYFTVGGTSGAVNCTGSNTSPSADGSCLAGTATNITTDTNISGIIDNAANMFLTGVMLDANAPAPPPANLDFSTNTNFTSLSPLLQQSFFIGDGLTGTGSGTTQQFQIPAGATRLFLGYADAASYNGLEGCYSDNGGGSLSATVTFAFPAVAVPTPAASALGLWLLGALLALGSIATLWRRA